MVENFLRNLASYGVGFEDDWRIHRLKRRSACRQCDRSDRRTIMMIDGRSPGLSLFTASNGPARWHYARELAKSVYALAQSDRHSEWLHVTIIDHRFFTSAWRPKLRYKELTDAARRILSAIAPDFTAGIEAQIFHNRYAAEGGYLITPHVHAVVWGRNIYEHANSVADKANGKLSTGIPGIDAVRVQQIGQRPDDYCRVVPYPYKAVHRNKNAYLNLRTGKTNLNESEKNDRSIRFLRMSQISSLTPQRHLTIGSGEGVKLNNSALVAVNARLQIATNWSSKQSQLDFIVSFWDDLIPRLGHWRYEKPQIVF